VTGTGASAPRRVYAGLFTVSLTTVMFEIPLTRIFSVTDQLRTRDALVLGDERGDIGLRVRPNSGDRDEHRDLRRVLDRRGMLCGGWSRVWLGLP
jgi:hypothetical protein